MCYQEKKRDKNQEQIGMINASQWFLASGLAGALNGSVLEFNSVILIAKTQHCLQHLNFPNVGMCWRKRKRKVLTVQALRGHWHGRVHWRGLCNPSTICVSPRTGYISAAKVCGCAWIRLNQSYDGEKHSLGLLSKEQMSASLNWHETSL